LAAFRRDPAGRLVRWLYQRKTGLSLRRSTSSSLSPILIVCISDTHTTRPDVPDGDVLLHAGDLTSHGSFAELQAQLDWLKTLPHKYKVVIAGNHDLLLDQNFVNRFPDRIFEGEGTSRGDLDWSDIIYLNNTAAHLEFSSGRALTVYGSPWTEQFGTWAFQYPPIRRVWSETIPPGTDILLTHGPPKGHLDERGKSCPQLLREIWRARPRLVVFGHIHSGYGREDIAYDAFEATYDGVIVRDKGMLAVFFMACLLVFNWLRNVLLLPRRRHSLPASTILVNAAVAAGQLNEKLQKPIVVEL
jgi:predicted phosphodiesterase